MLSPGEYVNISSRYWVLAMRGSNAPVWHQGPPGELRAVVPALEELDLSGCLLPDWPALCGVLGELPRLRLLNLSATRVTPPPPPPAAVAEAGVGFSGLRTLIMNRCALQWSQVRLRLLQIAHVALPATSAAYSGAILFLPCCIKGLLSAFESHI